MIDPEPYVAAAKAGVNAVPRDGDYARVDPNPIGKAHAAHRRQYAEKVPARVSTAVAQFANALVDDLDPAEIEDRIADIRERIEAKIAKQGSDVTRYAEPSWSAGHAGYGEQLGASGVLLVWVLDDGAEHCDDCPELASTSPYSSDDIPTWPAQGDTECLDRCRCTIQADAATWAEAFPNAA